MTKKTTRIHRDTLTFNRFLLPVRATDPERAEMFRLIVDTVDAVTYYAGAIEVASSENEIIIRRLDW